LRFQSLHYLPYRTLLHPNRQNPLSCINSFDFIVLSRLVGTTDLSDRFIVRNPSLSHLDNQSNEVGTRFSSPSEPFPSHSGALKIWPTSSFGSPRANCPPRPVHLSSAPEICEISPRLGIWS
jgi:hypothetical protein